MPVRPPSVSIRCTACNWHSTWHPTSDALIAPAPAKCPKCGSETLEYNSLGTSASWSSLASMLKDKLFSR